MTSTVALLHPAAALLLSTRRWAGLSRDFLGHSRDVLANQPTVPSQLRLAIFGGCIVLDLIRQKKSRGS